MIICRSLQDKASFAKGLCKVDLFWKISGVRSKVGFSEKKKTGKFPILVKNDI